MGTPGSGRYTKYVPVDAESAARYNARLALFNNKADANLGKIYDGADFAAIAANVVANAKVKFAENDTSTFPVAPSKTFGDAPNLEAVEWKKAGDPANAYAPDIRSPGPGKTLGTEKEGDPGLPADSTVWQNQNPDFTPGATAGTASPTTTSPSIGALPIGVELEPGKLPPAP
jgi:hypothetical protein